MDEVVSCVVLYWAVLYDDVRIVRDVGPRVSWGRLVRGHVVKDGYQFLERDLFSFRGNKF